MRSITTYLTSILMTSQFAVTLSCFSQLGLLVSMVPPASATTIAYDGHNLAADTQYTMGTQKGKVVKIYRVKDVYIACAGAVSNVQPFIHWYEDGHDPAKYPKLRNFIGYVLTKDGLYCYEEANGHPMKETAPCAIGSGAKAAIGGMKAGADARRAVQIAEEIDLYTGGEITSVSIDDLNTPVLVGRAQRTR